MKILPLCLLFVGCTNSLVSIPPSPERIQGPFAIPQSRQVPIAVDQKFVKNCTELKLAYRDLLRDLPSIPEGKDRTMLLGTKVRVESALKTCDGELGKNAY